MRVHDDYRVLQWKSFPERSRNRKHRIGFNKVSMPKRARGKGDGRLHVNEYNIWSDCTARYCIYE